MVQSLTICSLGGDLPFESRNYTRESLFLMINIQWGLSPITLASLKTLYPSLTCQFCFMWIYRTSYYNFHLDIFNWSTDETITSFKIIRILDISQWFCFCRNASRVLDDPAHDIDSLSIDSVLYKGAVISISNSLMSHGVINYYFWRYFAIHREYWSDNGM